MHREEFDGVEVLGEGRHSCACDAEPRKLHVLRAELKLGWVEDDATAAKRLQELDGSPPVLL